MKNKYIEGIDLLKIMACFCVVGAHVLQRHEGIFNELLFCILITWAIPMFFLVNGFLILGKENLKYHYIFRKVKNVFITVFLWNLVYSIEQYIRGNVWVNPLAESLKNLFLQAGVFWVFWFLGALILTWLISPILHKVLRGKYWKYMLVVLGVICIVLDMFSKVYFCLSKIAIFAMIPQTFRIWLWFLYFYLGGVLNIKIKKSFCDKKHLLLFTLCMIIVCNTITEYLIGFSQNVTLWPEHFYGSFLSILETIIIFLLMNRIKVKNQNILKKFSDSTVGIYIIHMFLIMFIAKWYDYQYVIINIILIFVFFMVSALITILISRFICLRRFVSFR